LREIGSINLTLSQLIEKKKINLNNLKNKKSPEAFTSNASCTPHPPMPQIPNYYNTKKNYKT